MSNRYNQSKTAILDASGKEWTVETWHSLPIPDGIDYHLGNIVKYGPLGECNYWLAHPPLPDLPKPKSQDELDEWSAKHFMESYDISKNATAGQDAFEAFLAGVAYARKTSQPTTR